MIATSPAAVRRAWIAWVAVCLIWGTTYFGIKISLETMPPFLMGGLRYVMAGAMLAAILIAMGRPLPPRDAWGRLTVLGFFMLFLGNGGVVWGELYVPSGLTAVLIGTSPFWMVSIDAMLNSGRQLHVRQWIGLLVGFAGIVLLVWPDIVGGGISGRNFALGVVAIQIACAGWGVGSAYTRRHVMPKDVLGAAAVQMFAGGIFLTIAGTLTGEWPRLSFSPRTLTAFLYLVIIGAVVAFAAYSYALRYLDIAIVSLYSYVNPVIAVALGTIFLDEPFHIRMLVAAAIIVVGIVIVGPIAPASDDA